MYNKFTKHLVMQIVTFIFLLNLALFAIPAYAAETSFSWLPSPEATVDGYKIYLGRTTGNYTDTVDIGKPSIENNRNIATITDLEDETTYYAVVTSYDREGQESSFSEEISWTTSAPPVILLPPPTITRIQVSR